MSTDELEVELKRRKELAKQVPLPVANPDFTALIEEVVKTTMEGLEQGYEDDDTEHFVWEAAVKAVYGPKYFEWRAQQSW